MAYLKAHVGIKAFASGTGTLDLTVPGVGTPHAIAWTLTKATLLNSSTNGVIIAQGFAADDGTCDYKLNTFEDATSNVDSHRRQDFNGAVDIISEPAGAVIGTFEHDSDGASSGPVTNGWRINVTSNTSLTGIQIAYTLFVGSGLSATVLNDSSSTSTPTTHTVGFQTGLALLSTIGDTNENSTRTFANQSFGYATYDGTTLRQGMAYLGTQDGQATSVNAAGVYNDRVGCQALNGTMQHHAVIDSVNATQITISANTFPNEKLAVLCLELDSSQGAWVGNIQSHTSTSTDWTETGPGFEPQYIELMGGVGTAVNVNNTSNSDVWHRGGLDADGNQFSVAFFFEDAASTHVARCTTAAKLSRSYSSLGSLASDVDTDGSALNANGFTIPAADINAIWGSARTHLFLALEAEADSGVTGTGASIEAADTSSGAGAVTALGSAANTEAADTSSATGAVTALGTGASSEAADTSSASGTVTITGAAAANEAADTSEGTGEVVGVITGAGASSELADISAGAGTVTIPGAGASVEASDVSAGLGFVGGAIVGLGASSEADDVSFAHWWTQEFGPVARLNTDIFFDPKFGFAETVVAGSTSLYGIFRGFATDGFSEQGPQCRLKQADVEAYDIGEGDVIVVRGQNFVIEARQDDGHGTSIMLLRDA